MTTSIMEMPAATEFEITPPPMDAFQTGVLNGRKDVIILMLVFIFNNQQATRNETWDFIVRIETIIKENPAADILELSALMKQETQND